MKTSIGLILCLCAAFALADTTVTMESLLQEMVDRDAVARIPDPYYICKQASSWDRLQKSVNGPNWFANHDYDHSLRQETVGTRVEYVIMENEGPGCVTRIWKPLDISNNLPKMTIRFYLDGELDPVIESDFTELLSGKSLFKEPFSFIASDEKDEEHQFSLPKGHKQFGGDLYFPIPYAKGCKVTVEAHKKPSDANHNVFFYIINYRSYLPGTSVKTFCVKDYESNKQFCEQIGKQLSKPGSDVKQYQSFHRKATLNAGQSESITLPKGSNAIRKISVSIPQNSYAEVVRDLWVQLEFGGNKTVSCPLSEFFGGGYFPRDAHPAAPEADNEFIRSHWNRNRSVNAKGRFESWFVMPYESSAALQILNKGSKVIEVNTTVGVGEWSWDDRSMYFHANWRSDETSAEFSDWNYIEIEGAGVYVADTLTVFSPAAIWYGEGDERIYIDGETFPSHLGTGTEDYYGYAWGMANYWSSPFISAPSRDSRGKGDWRGSQTVSRERLLDAIPFKKSLKVDMEAWNGAGVRYTAGVMWYARPGATSNRDAKP